MVPFEINWNLIYGLDENVSNGVNNYIGNKLDSFLRKHVIHSNPRYLSFPHNSHTSYIKRALPSIKNFVSGEIFFQSSYLLAC